jgi:hypothetical protein
MASASRRRFAMPLTASVGFSGRDLKVTQSTAMTVAEIGINHQMSADTSLG